MAVELSIVLPCFNEEGNLPELIQEFDEIVAGRPFEVIFVDNGSVDGSAEVFEQEMEKASNRGQLRLITVPKNIGYGHGVLTGLAHAEGRVLSYSHADLQCDPKNLITAWNLFLETENQRGMAQANVLVKGRRINRREEEKLFSHNLDRLAQLVMQGPMVDINGQPKMFVRSFFEKCLSEAPQDMTFDVYVMARAIRQGLEIKTFPVHFGERKAGVSSWNTTLRSRLRMASRFALTVFKARVQTLRKI